MIIAVPKEILPGEKRVAGSPDTVAKLVAKGFAVQVQSGAGQGAHFSDAAYEKAGAQIVANPDELWPAADVVAKVNPPMERETKAMKSGAVLVSLLNPFENRDGIDALAQQGVTAFSLELVPRSTRAQSMDVLSSQANLVGYKAVLQAANAYGGVFPMFMTAAGTVRPAKVLVLGAGVAGLQAIATAKRLGAQVSAFDVRPAVKTEVESLGAKFIELDMASAEGEGGYARQLTEEEQKKQIELLGEHVARMDIIITTAAIPGRAAPRLITADTVQRMKPGSVIVDLAAKTGGNCELTQADEIVSEHGVVIIGLTDQASALSAETSNLFSRNVFNFIMNMQTADGVIEVNTDDDIVAGSLVTRNGEIMHPRLTETT
jgi:NAD(P) transhydrogenase subunit alpha